MPNLLSLALLGALLLGACRAEPRDEPRSSTVEQAGGPVESADTANPDSLRDRFIRHALTPIGETRQEIRSRLGEPERIAVEAVANRHDPTRTDSIFTLTYDDLTIVIHQAAGGREFLSSVTVEDNCYLREAAIRIGMSWDEVRRRLGEPQEEREEGYVYHCGPCVVPQPVIVSVGDGVVRAIHFTYYVD